MALLSGGKSVAGLDIGSSSIKIVQLKETGKGYRLINLGVRSLPQEVIVDGAIMDAGVISDTLREMVKEIAGIDDAKNEEFVAENAEEKVEDKAKA